MGRGEVVDRVGQEVDVVGGGHRGGHRGHLPPVVLLVRPQDLVHERPGRDVGLRGLVDLGGYSVVSRDLMAVF